MINRATSRPELTYHISEQFVGIDIPDRYRVDYSFHGFKMQFVNII